MRLARNEFFWLALFLLCLTGYYLTEQDWLVGLAFVPAVPFGWLSLKYQWKRMNG